MLREKPALHLSKVSALASGSQTLGDCNNGKTKLSNKSPSTYQKGYQQALEDFAIAPLLARLKNDCDANLEKEDLESLAAILIQELTANLTSKLIAGYVNAWRRSNWDVSRLSQCIPQPSVDLPVSFPKVETPRFMDGDKLRWIPCGKDTDWGVVIGRFYGFAPHHYCWTWCYILWLDKNSPSAAWTVADIAWEEDLEAEVKI